METDIVVVNATVLSLYIRKRKNVIKLGCIYCKGRATTAITVTASNAVWLLLSVLDTCIIRYICRVFD